MRHPCELAWSEIEAFLTMLATERKVSTSTHNQALSALLFLYREVLRGGWVFFGVPERHFRELASRLCGNNGTQPTHFRALCHNSIQGLSSETPPLVQLI